jgi:DNA-3-methyladenine glycosylase
MRLRRDFYDRPTPLVAQDLLGQRLVCGPYRGLIIETEAYRGEDDPACHAARGKTPRHAVMYGPPGHAYVYFIYGRYFCFNIVTETEGMPAAVLIRGLLLEMPEALLLNGPGRLCSRLGITREDNGVDLVTSPSLYVEETGFRPIFAVTPRIGIKVGIHIPWRYVVQDVNHIHTSLIIPTKP